jgi:2-keto-4-pentenoate hydratase
LNPIESTAGLLAWAHRGPALLGLPEELRPGSLEAAEAIQHETLVVLGDRAGGWKLGRHGGHLFSAPLPASRTLHAGEEASVTVPPDSLIEMEIAIRFRAAVPPAAVATLEADALPGLASIAVLFEFVHSRFAPDAVTGPLDRIADCLANHGAAVRTTPLPWSLAMLDNPPAVRLSQDGAVIARHEGPHVATPVGALIEAWITRLRRETRGIAAGEVVTFGSLTGMLPIPPEGARYEGEIEGLEPLRCTISIAPPAG